VADRASLTVENFEQLCCVQCIRIIKVKLDYDDVYVRVKRNYGLTKLGMTANNPQHASLFNYLKKMLGQNKAEVLGHKQLSAT